MSDLSKPRPPAFHWEEWYASVGGRSIKIDAVEDYLQQIKEYQYPRFDGPVASEKKPFVNEDSASALIKSLAMECGADEVGIARIEEEDIYRGRTVEEKYAIVLGQRMLWRAFQTVPSTESAIECMRIYFSLGEIVIALAEKIRAMGYPCRVEHPVGDSNVLHIPLALKAGFGELGRHGSIIHPEMGPLFRIGSVLTDLPLSIDSPIDVGIAAFCDNCKACRLYCPADAIPDDRSTEVGPDHIGKDRYVVDTGKCFPYFAKHNYCSACLAVCVYEHKEWARDFESFKTKLFPELPFESPPPAVDPEVDKHWYPKIKRAE